MKATIKTHRPKKFLVADTSKPTGESLGVIDLGTLTVSAKGFVSVSLKNVAESKQFKDDLAILKDLATVAPVR